MTETTTCWNCKYQYPFIRNQQGDTYLTCPRCGNVGVIKQKIVTEIVYEQRPDTETKWKTTVIVLVFCCVILVGLCITINNSLQNETNKLTIKINDLDKAYANIATLTTNIQTTTEELNQTQTSLYEALNPYMKGIGFYFLDTREPTEQELFTAEESLHICHNPTYNQVVNFVESNDLDDYLYPDWFDCDEYSYTLINDSRAKHIRCGYVVIDPKPEEYDWYNDSTYVTHAIVVFNTTDRGLIFVEPQLDDIFTYNEFITMQTNHKYYAEDDSYSEYLYSLEMDFDHYTIDWFAWYHPSPYLLIYSYKFYLFQMWDLYKNEYPNFKSDYSNYFKYEAI